MNELGTNPPKQTKRNEIGLQEFHTHASQPAVLMTPIKKRLKSESDWFSSYCSTRGTLTHGGPLLAFSPRTVGVEDPDDFVKAAVELRAVRRETQRMGRCQLIQVVVGSKRCSEVPIKRVPYVDRVVSATAGNAEGKEKKLEYIAKSQNFPKQNLLFWEKQEIATSGLTVRLAFFQTHNTKDPFTIDNLTNEELKKHLKWKTTSTAR